MTEETERQRIYKERADAINNSPFRPSGIGDAQTNALNYIAAQLWEIRQLLEKR